MGLMFFGNVKWLLFNRLKNKFCILYLYSVISGRAILLGMFQCLHMCSRQESAANATAGRGGSV